MAFIRKKFQNISPQLTVAHNPPSHNTPKFANYTTVTNYIMKTSTTPRIAQTGISTVNKKLRCTVWMADRLIDDYC